MAASMHDIDSLLNEIELNRVPSQNHVLAFHLNVLELIRHKLPPIASEGLATAARGASDIEIEQVIAKSWAQLRQHPDGDNTVIPEVAAIRCVLCVLIELVRPESDFVNSVAFFLNLVNLVEPHVEEEAQLVRRHFADSLCLRPES